jgi:hypothetical protein
MGDFHSIRRAVVTFGVAIMLVLAGGGAAHAAAWHWSQPLRTDNTQGQSLNGLQCPSATECVTLSASNQLVAFGPDQAVSPGTVVTPEAPGHVLMGLSCPSVSQCETITADGELVGADPASGGDASTVQLQPVTDQPVVDGLHAIDCVSTDLCVVVTGAGQAISFDPSSPGSAQTATLVSGQEFGLVALSCPSATQCTAVGHSVAVTFDPTTLAVSASGALAGSQSLVSQVDCPDTTECVASTSAGRALTFAPDSPGTAVATTLETGQLYPIVALSCPSAGDCVAASQEGHVIVFAPGGAVISNQPAGGGADSYAGGTFLPITALICQATQCGAVTSDGQYATFDPANPGVPVLSEIGGGTDLVAVSCAVATSCDVIGPSDETQIKPAGPSAGPHRYVNNFPLTDIACPKQTQCTAIAADFSFSYNPRHFRTPRKLTRIHNDNGMSAIACPTASQCTVITSGGYEQTYHPVTGKGIRSAFAVEEDEALLALACPSTTLCVALDDNGTAITFAPTTGKRIAVHHIDPRVGLSAPSGGSDQRLSAIACPSVSRCVATDSLGDVVAFNPRTGGAKVTGVSAFPLSAISCASSSSCFAVNTAGQVLKSQGTGWHTTTLVGATSLTGISCKATVCAVIDSNGDSIIGRAGRG